MRPRFVADAFANFVLAGHDILLAGYVNYHEELVGVRQWVEMLGERGALANGYDFAVEKGVQHCSKSKEPRSLCDGKLASASS